MGRLAQLAKASSGKLKGKVQVNYADGTSRVFENEAQAEEATKALDVEHRRGAFFEVVKKDAPAPAPASQAAPKAAKKSS